jgi:hypothetical protein
MFKELVIKKRQYVVVLTSLLLIVLVCACGESKVRQLNADQLLNRARQLYNNRLYDSSMIVLDTLAKRYPKEIPILREAMRLRSLSQEKLILIEIEKNDSTLAYYSQIQHELVHKFSYYKDPVMMEGYRVAKGLPQLAKSERSGIEPRINSAGEPYLASQLVGITLRHNIVRISASNGSYAATAFVAYDKAQNYRYKDGSTSYELITFRPNQCDSLLHFVALNVNRPLRLSFIGNASYTILLSSQEKVAISDTYRYAQAVQRVHYLSGRKIYLNKKLEITRKYLTMK